MELDIIKSQTTWNEASGSINSNFSKVRQAIIALQEAEGGGGSGEEGIDEAQLEAYLTLHKYVTQSWVGNALGDYDSAIKQWVNSQGFITSTGGGDIDLSDYAKEADLEALTTRFDAVFDGREDQDDYINKWHELVAFLDGIEEGDSLANTLVNQDDRLLALEDMFTWEYDSEGNRIAIRAKSHFFSTGQVAAGGIGTESGGGGGGGISLLFDSTKTWADYTSDMADYALAAYHGKALNDRLVKVEGKATDVSFTQTLLTGKPIGTIMVDGVSQTMYAPSRLSQMDADFVDKNLLPYDDGACSLGSASRQWTVVFAEDFEASNGVTAPLGEFGDLGAQTGVFVNLDVQRLSVFSDFLPSANNTGNIGGTSQWWKNVYATNVRTRFVYGNNGLGLYTYGGSIYLYDNINDYIADFSYSGSHIYTDLTVDGALTVNGASVATQTWAEERYLKLSGGAIGRDGSNSFPLNIESTSSYTGIAFVTSGGRAWMRYMGGSDWGVTDAEWKNSYTLLHSGNIGSYKAGSATKLEGLYHGSSDASNNPYFFVKENGKSKYYIQARAGMLYIGPTVNGIVVNSSSNVTIGASDLAGSDSVTPKLYISGNTRLAGSLYFTDGAYISYTNIHLPSNDGSNSFNIYGSGNLTLASFNSNGKTILGRQGNVGIGHNYPEYKLDVNGSSRLAWNANENSVLATPTALAIDSTTTGGWARNFLITNNGTTMFAFGAYGSGGSLSYGYVGGTYANPWVSFDSEKVQFNKNIRIGNAILSYDWNAGALKIEGNVYATGQVASGGIGTAVATIASDHEERIAQLEAKVQSLMS